MSTQQRERGTAAMGTNTDLVMQAMGAMRGGDVETGARLLADDFVWHIPGTSAISGDAVGFGAFAEKMHRLVGAGLQPEVLAVLEGESHVANLQHNVAEAAGHRLDQRVVNLFTIADGRIARLDTFFSDQPAAEAFWDAVLG